MPSVQGIATQVKRFACDRCHGQKLRCPRLDSRGDTNIPCTRCQRAGQVCNISSALKTGRPRKGSRRQARAEQHPSPMSPTLSRVSSNGTIDAPASHVSTNPVANVHRGETSYQSQAPESDPSAHVSYTNSTEGSLETWSESSGESSLPLAMEQYAKYLDFKVDISQAADIGCLGTTGEKDIWNLISTRYSPSTGSEFTDQITFQQQHSSAVDLFQHGTRTGVSTDALEGYMTADDSKYYMQCSPYLAPTEQSLEHGSWQPEEILQGAQYIYPNSTSTFEDKRIVFPYHCLDSSREENIEQCGLPASRSQPTSGNPNRELCVSGAQQRNNSLLQVQLEIYECSASITQPDALSEIGSELCRTHSRALAELFGATERFIRLISDACNPPNPTSPQDFNSRSCQPLITTDVSMNAMGNELDQPLWLKRGASLPALEEPSSHVMHDTYSAPHLAYPLDTAAFHLIMGCHTRLLAAYDTVVDSIELQLSDACQSARHPSAARLSSSAINNEVDTLPELRHRLQAISQHLRNLSDALRWAFRSAKALRQYDYLTLENSTEEARHAQVSATPRMLESATNVVGKKESLLQTKINRIQGLLNDPYYVGEAKKRLNLK